MSVCGEGEWGVTRVKNDTNSLTHNHRLRTCKICSLILEIYPHFNMATSTLLFGILVVLSLHHQVTAAPAATPRPIVGAIRWDAWNGVPVDNVSYWATKALSPNEWHARLPFFGNVTGENSVQFNGDTQAVMDAEIKVQKRAKHVDSTLLLLQALLLTLNKPIIISMQPQRD